MLVNNPKTEIKKDTIDEEEEIDGILSDLADVVIDDYLHRVATRCYTEIKSTSKNDIK